ncbi:hypothetical protein [Amycolatopsis sp. NPDC051128]|uniref:zinc finger domain-containing protein n=1 Tax=Amycolatopsis sp. NPDC051128 TaxID=3155412 RepID=UPI00341E7658
MTRHKDRANLRQGLWQDTAEQQYVPAHELRFEEEASPLLRACSACGAAPRQPCTRPSRRTGTGRTELRDHNHKPSYHPSRKQENP